jgi:hypothetical protein
MRSVPVVTQSTEANIAPGVWHIHGATDKSRLERIILMAAIFMELAIDCVWRFMLGSR